MDYLGIKWFRYKMPEYETSKYEVSIPTGYTHLLRLINLSQKKICFKFKNFEC